MQDGDVVVAADGEQVLGIGHATGPYLFEETDPVGAPHRRTVKWSSSEEWKPPTSSEGLRTTFFPLGKYPDNVIEIEKRLLQGDRAPASELLERGIHRDYEHTRSDLASPAGRIDFTRYARPAQRAKTTIPCVHHPRSEDTLLNRVLLAGLTHAVGLATDHELRAHVRRIGKILGETVAVQPIDPPMLAEAWR